MQISQSSKNRLPLATLCLAASGLATTSTAIAANEDTTSNMTPKPTLNDTIKSEWYIGAGVNTPARFTDQQKTGEVLSPTELGGEVVAVGPTDLNLDHHSLGYDIFLGKNLNEHAAVELGFTKSGQLGYKNYNDNPESPSFGQIPVTTTTNYHNWDVYLSGMAKLPVAESASLYFKTGIAYLQSKVEEEVVATGVCGGGPNAPSCPQPPLVQHNTDSSHTLGFTYGIGMEYNFSESFGVRAEYMLLTPNHDLDGDAYYRADNLNLQLMYRFYADVVGKGKGKGSAQAYNTGYAAGAGAAPVAQQTQPAYTTPVNPWGQPITTAGYAQNYQYPSANAGTVYLNTGAEGDAAAAGMDANLNLLPVQYFATAKELVRAFTITPNDPWVVFKLKGDTFAVTPVSTINTGTAVGENAEILLPSPTLSAQADAGLQAQNPFVELDAKAIETTSLQHELQKIAEQRAGEITDKLEDLKTGESLLLSADVNDDGKVLSFKPLSGSVVRQLAE